METGSNLAEASVIHIRDTRFDHKQAQNYHLLLDVSTHRYSYALFNQVEQTLTSCFSKQFTDGSSLIADLEQEPLLRHRYGQVLISLPDTRCCCVADELFDEAALKTYFQFNFAEPVSGQLYADHITQAGMRLIGDMDGKLRSSVKSLFTEAKVMSRTAVWLTNAMRDYGVAKEDQLLVHLHDSTIQVVVLQKGKLLCLNSYQVQAASDVVYFCLALAEQLGLNPAKMQVLFSSEPESDDSLLADLPTYFAQVTPLGRPKAIKYAEALNELPANSFYHLFSLSICG